MAREIGNYASERRKYRECVLNVQLQMHSTVHRDRGKQNLQPPKAAVAGGSDKTGSECAQSFAHCPAKQRGISQE